ncbi:MAG: type II secretion system F family protein [Hyphomonadaceae bacterium]|nr:type II secretion system F family protein [Hyphomonadaceae bacterium]
MDPALIASALAFLAFAGIGLAFSQPSADAVRAAKRAKDINAKRPSARKIEIDQGAAKRKAGAQEALKELTANEKKSRKRRLSVKGLIEQAGLNITETHFWIISGCTGVVLAGIGFFIQQSWIGPLIGLFIGGLGLPRWVLKFLIGARQKKFTNQLADGIDIIVRGVKSGLPLNQCLRMIAAESPQPLRQEFANLVDANAMGVPLEQSLTRMHERMPLPEVNFFGIVLMIQQRTGGNLSEALANLSSVLRSRKLMRAKIQALSSEAKTSAGIIGSLPFFVVGIVYLIQPDYMTLLFVTPVGNIILMVAFIMMSIGVLVMRNMINFKF